MSRILLIITSVLAIAGIVFGLNNRSALVDARTNKDIANETAREELNEVDELVDKIEEEIKKVEAAKEEREVAQVGADEASRKMGQIKSQIAAKTQQIEAKQARIDEVRQILEPFEGVTPENLNDKLADLERQAEEKSENVVALQNEIEIAQAAADRKRSEMGVYNDGQRERAELIALQAQEATVTAVNPDFGFAVVNAGTSRGVPADAKIYVKRGAEKVAQLKIRELTRSMLIGDIIGDGNVQPGDQVIFETNVN